MDLEITVDFLKSVANPKVISIYSVHTQFNASDSRHMSVQAGSIIVGLLEVGEWIFGCPDVKPNVFGFVPKNYLKFVQKIQR
jgi:hypothetical protein